MKGLHRLATLELVRLFPSIGQFRARARARARALLLQHPITCDY